MPEAIYIPADHRKPVALVNYEGDSMSLEQMRDLIFDGVEETNRLIDMRSIGSDHESGLYLTDVFDDEGLFNTPLAINLRMMMIYQLTHVAGDLTQWAVPLVGNHILLPERRNNDGEEVGTAIPGGMLEDIQSFLPGPVVSVNGEEVHRGWAGF